ncbi:MAG: hypothetical protein AB7K37_06460 [Cyclobacteriaceae bacterium]
MTHSEFSHDIFISYRHNDNKPPGGVGEGWVTEFVSYLTTELETMVKGKVSVYFDKNPHHGLSDTHQVEASLSTHLNALIFIPILSQTYCDPESYAWKFEFLPFLRQAASDHLGLTIKLYGGNVATRVLPICIHELEPADTQRIEVQLNSRLRAINFVYRAPGVNRPLRAREEDPLKNNNRIHYHDQINKVANAVREIISSVKMPQQKARDVKLKPSIASILGDLPHAKSSFKTIAVLPLNFQPRNASEEYLSQGFAEDLFNALKLIKALRLSIHGLSGEMNGASAKNWHSKTAWSLTGSIQIEENKLRVFIDLVDNGTDTIAWEGRFECERDEFFHLKGRVVKQICDFLSINLQENESQAIESPIASVTKAIALLWKARYHWRKRGNDLLTSLECYQKAADLDPESAVAYAGIACTTALLGHYEMIPFAEAVLKTKVAAMRSLALDPTVVEAYFGLAYVALCYELGWPEMEQNFKRVFGLNGSSGTAVKKFRRYLTQVQCSFEDMDADPVSSIPHFLHAYALLHKGKFEEGLSVSQIAMQKAPESFMAQRAAGLCYLGLGYHKEAIDALNSAANLSNRHPMILFDLVGAYAAMSGSGAAQGIMEEALQEISAIPARVSDFFFQSA